MYKNDGVNKVFIKTWFEFFALEGTLSCISICWTGGGRRCFRAFTLGDGFYQTPVCSAFYLPASVVREISLVNDVIVSKIKATWETIQFSFLSLLGSCLEWNGAIALKPNTQHKNS